MPDTMTPWRGTIGRWRVRSTGSDALRMFGQFRLTPRQPRDLVPSSRRPRRLCAGSSWTSPYAVRCLLTTEGSCASTICSAARTRTVPESRSSAASSLF